MHPSASSPTPPGPALLDGPRGVPDGFPDWFRAGGARAWEEFGRLPPPARTDERWRFAHPARLALDPYRCPEDPRPGSAEGILAQLRGVDDVVARFVFANDRLLTEEPAGGLRRAGGLICGGLQSALAEAGDLGRDHFAAQDGALGSERFAALHRAFVRAGTFVYVPRGVELEGAIETFHWLDGEGASCFPHTLVIAAPGSAVTVIDHFRGTPGSGPGFACAASELVAMDGARVRHVALQEWGTDTVAVHLNETRVGRDASVLSLQLNLGARYARSESVSRLRAPGARVDMLALTLAGGTQEIDLRTLQEHLHPHTSSDLLYKNALDDAARAVFGGLIRVGRGAHFADAYQKVRNLLLSDAAAADSLPGLEILANDVRCTHGATSGHVHADEMFYLRSRGIPPALARRLVVFGFLDEVIARLADRSCRDLLRERLEARLGSITRP